METLDVRRRLASAEERNTALTSELSQAQRHIEHLETALQTNRQIAIAIGILMARRAMTADEAFDLLRKISQGGNRRIRDLADDIVYTGELPEDVAS